MHKKATVTDRWKMYFRHLISLGGISFNISSKASRNQYVTPVSLWKSVLLLFPIWAITLWTLSSEHLSEALRSTWRDLCELTHEQKQETSTASGLLVCDMGDSLEWGHRPFPFRGLLRASTGVSGPPTSPDTPCAAQCGHTAETQGKKTKQNCNTKTNPEEQPHVLTCPISLLSAPGHMSPCVHSWTLDTF